MAELVLKDPAVCIGTSGSPTTTLTPYVRSVTINYSAELQDKTASGDATRDRIAGLKDWSITVSFNQDFASTDVDKFVWGLIGAESSNSYIDVRTKTTKATASNPRYHGRGLLESYSPLGQSVGDLVTFDLTFQAAGDLTRAATSR
jgi:hypothetical protein